MTHHDMLPERAVAQADEATLPGPGSSQAHSEILDREVAAAVQGLTALVGDVDDIHDVLTHVAGLAVALVPFAEGAAATVLRVGDGPLAMTASAASDSLIGEIAHAQYDICGEGPGLTAMRTGRAMVSGSLGSDTRWRRFGARVRPLLVHSALALPLLARDTVVGVIDLYAHERHAFSENAVYHAEQFSGPAAVSLRNVQLLHAAQAQARQLQHVVTTRAVIDQATGIIRSYFGGSVDDAFDRLEQISHTQHVALHLIAEQVVDEAVRRAHARQLPPPD